MSYMELMPIKADANMEKKLKKLCKQLVREGCLGCHASENQKRLRVMALGLDLFCTCDDCLDQNVKHVLGTRQFTIAKPRGNA